MAYDENNPFAKILRGEWPCTRVAETDTTIAFMDLMPQAEGHVLVLPKEKAAEIFELSEAAAADCIKLTRRVALAVRETLKPHGLFIGQFNGKASGQTVPHVHFHVIPRWDNVALHLHAKDPVDVATLEALAVRIRANLKD